MERAYIDFTRKLFYRKQRFDLGRECEASLCLRVIDRLDAQTIAGDEEFLFFRIPYGECEHTVEFFDAAFSPFAISRNHNFRVGIGSETVSERFERSTQFGKVVDFAVIGYPNAPVRRRHGLPTRRR